MKYISLSLRNDAESSLIVGKTLNKCRACKWLRMFEAVASRLKTAAKAENCFKSPRLLHKDCFNIVAKFGIDEKLTYTVDELQICCKNL